MMLSGPLYWIANDAEQLHLRRMADEFEPDELRSAISDLHRCVTSMTDDDIGSVVEMLRYLWRAIWLSRVAGLYDASRHLAEPSALVRWSRSEIRQAVECFSVIDDDVANAAVLIATEQASNERGICSF